MMVFVVFFPLGMLFISKNKQKINGKKYFVKHSRLIREDGIKLKVGSSGYGVSLCVRQAYLRCDAGQR